MFRLKQHELYIWLLGLFIFYCYIAFMMPLHSSDWFWGSHQGMQAVTNHFEQIDGDYISNLLAFAITQSATLRVVSYGTISILLVLMMLKFVTYTFSTNTFILIILFIFIIPNSIFAQSYGNFELFYSYVFGTCIALYILHFVVSTFILENEFKFWNICIFWIACVIGQWFAETLTFYNVMMLLSALIIYFIWKRKINFNLLIGFMLTLCGPFIMLFNESYIYHFINIKNLRAQVDELGFFHKIKLTLFEQLPQYIFFDNIFLISLIAIVLIILLVNNVAFKEWSRYKRFFLICGISALPIYRILIYVPFNLKQLAILYSYGIINIIICLMFYISVFIASFYIVKNRYMRVVIEGIGISIILNAIPIFLIGKVVPQYFFMIYTLWCLLAVILLTTLGRLTQSIFNILKLLTILLMVVYIIVCTTLHFENEKRVDAIHTQINNHKNELVIHHLPFETYFSGMTPTNEIDQENFKEYHHIPNDKKIKVLPFEIKETND
ncbi:hypothetical protein MT340_002595 [Staphylococcus sp. NRL 16/872]|uniref:hypothetical protein n=1 Tax=Staphylococcus sp. NRL 16/872 TaxID=2930131 RepID=UPI001FB38AAC|nr:MULTISPECIES: hypothetical protein [unclassified Staphylococcus]MCJ1655651.1 hypothetical protein [Staphylococcus sp. NRL 21/187]WEN69857.1 hypothetical protein MT340_002595 [Staphylococcus sp. NRL 16/872]